LKISIHNSKILKHPFHPLIGCMTIVPKPKVPGDICPMFMSSRRHFLNRHFSHTTFVNPTLVPSPKVKRGNSPDTKSHKHNIPQNIGSHWGSNSDPFFSRPLPQTGKMSRGTNRHIKNVAWDKCRLGLLVLGLLSYTSLINPNPITKPQTSSSAAQNPNPTSAIAISSSYARGSSIGPRSKHARVCCACKPLPTPMAFSVTCTFPFPSSSLSLTPAQSPPLVASALFHAQSTHT